MARGEPSKLIACSTAGADFGRYGPSPVIDWASAALLLMAMGSPSAVGTGAPMQFAQVIIREQIIVRVPARMRQVSPAAPSLIEWKESKGPKCVPAKSILGASLLGQNSVDLILRDKSRIRAKLEGSCPALDYYYGFYIRPDPDGQICADRDSIRSRLGGQCEIERFRTLKAKSNRPASLDKKASLGTSR